MISAPDTHAADAPPTATSVCELLSTPERFSGKQVVFDADLINPRRFALKDDDCERVLLALPDEEDVRPSARFKLVEDAAYGELRDAVWVLVTPPGHEAGRLRARFEGRFDSLATLRRGRLVQQDPRSLRLAEDEVRLVLRKVSDVRIEEPKPRP